MATDVITLLRSYYVPQALFFLQTNAFLVFWWYVIALLHYSYKPQAVLVRQKVTHKWLWLYLWCERIYKDIFNERANIHKWLWHRLGQICDASDFPPVMGGGYLSLSGRTFWNYKVITNRRTWVVKIIRMEKLEAMFSEKYISNINLIWIVIRTKYSWWDPNLGPEPQNEKQISK